MSSSNLVIKNRTNITKDYIINEIPIGKGAFGEVRQAIHKKSGMKRAIKIIYKKNLLEDSQNQLISEVEMLKNLVKTLKNKFLLFNISSKKIKDHPNIIKIFEFFEDKKHFYIVTELYTGGELFQKKFNSEQELVDIMKQLFSTLVYLHSKHIVHRFENFYFI